MDFPFFLCFYEKNYPRLVDKVKEMLSLLPTPSLPMRTAWPATWSSLSGMEIFLRDSDATLSRLFLLCGFHPTDPLIAREWCNVFPSCNRDFIRRDDHL